MGNYIKREVLFNEKNFEDAVENAVKKYEAAGLTPQEAYEKAIQELTKQ